MEPRISVTAAAHVAHAHPAITLIDLDSPDWLTTHLPAGGYAIESGRLRLCGGPGRGREPLAAADDPPWTPPPTQRPERPRLEQPKTPRTANPEKPKTPGHRDTRGDPDVPHSAPVLRPFLAPRRLHTGRDRCRRRCRRPARRRQRARRRDRPGRPRRPRAPPGT